MYQLTVNSPYVIKVSDGSNVLINPDDPEGYKFFKWLDGYEDVNGEWIKTSDANTPLPAD